MKSLGLILGSSFDEGLAGLLEPQPVIVETEWGAVEMRRARDRQNAYVHFRHGLPHRLLPHQIPYRAIAAAFDRLNCGALLVTSSVGVLDSRIPLFQPMLLSDLIWPENRLPDGDVCSMFRDPRKGQGHLVLEEGPFSAELSASIATLAEGAVHPMPGGLTFGYAGGPRTKTRAENRMFALWGAQVNSMTLAPEVILANELGIACAGLVTGHKYSLDETGGREPLDIAESLRRARDAMLKVLTGFLLFGEPVRFRNSLHRFG